MSFSDHLRKLAQPIWDAQLSHPFVVALGNGRLPERNFKYYILQDARFLADLARVFSAAALRAPDSESALRFTKLAEQREGLAQAGRRAPSSRSTRRWTQGYRRRSPPTRAYCAVPNQGKVHEPCPFS